MNNKYITTFLLIIITINSSCDKQPQNVSPPTVPQGANIVATEMPLSTQIPISTQLSLVPTATPSETDVNIPRESVIAYSTWSAIKLIDPNNGMPVSLISDPAGLLPYGSPSWSPDGKTIIFDADRGGGGQIYKINRDGSGLRKFLEYKNLGLSFPSWSSDGEHIAFSSYHGIVVTDSDGQNLQQIGVFGEFPTWSPDGKKLAVLGDVSSHNKIFIVDSDGKNLESITADVAGESQLSWSPDGNKIAFRSSEGCGDIDIVDLKTSVVTNLTNNPKIVHLNPAWSPDGNFIVFAENSYTPCDQVSGIYLTGNSLFIMRLSDQKTVALANAKGDQPSWWPTVILQPNWKYSVTKAGSNLNVRESPATSANSLIKLQQGDIFTALDDSIEADNYHWRKIRTEGGIEGWIVDVPGWYMFESAP